MNQKLHTISGEMNKKLHSNGGMNKKLHTTGDEINTNLHTTGGEISTNLPTTGGLPVLRMLTASADLTLNLVCIDQYTGMRRVTVSLDWSALMG